MPGYNFLTGYKQPKKKRKIDGNFTSPNQSTSSPNQNTAPSSPAPPSQDPKSTTSSTINTPATAHAKATDEDEKEVKALRKKYLDLEKQLQTETAKKEKRISRHKKDAQKVKAEVQQYEEHIAEDDKSDQDLEGGRDDIGNFERALAETHLAEYFDLFSAVILTLNEFWKELGQVENANARYHG